MTSSGREDVDVRCLGNGRPFIIEIQRPTRLPSSEKLTLEIAQFNAECADVNINGICHVSREATKKLLDGEMAKTKSYRAYCYAQRELTQTDLDKLTLVECELRQKTPVRVLHRRNVDTRPRTVHRLFRFFPFGKMSHFQFCVWVDETDQQKREKKL